MSRCACLYLLLTNQVYYFVLLRDVQFHIEMVVFGKNKVIELVVIFFKCFSSSLMCRAALNSDFHYLVEYEY